jgi:hypothetical protein
MKRQFLRFSLDSPVTRNTRSVIAAVTINFCPQLTRMQAAEMSVYVYSTKRCDRERETNRLRDLHVLRPPGFICCLLSVCMYVRSVNSR